MELKTLFGLPAHPLVVHAAVVLVPLAALGALLCLYPPIRRHLGIAVFVLAIMGTAATAVAQSTGEEFQEQVTETQLVEEHAEMGENLLPWVILLDVGVGGLVALDLWQRRAAKGAPDDAPPTPPSWVKPAAIGLSILMAVTAIGSTVTVVEIGHSGAKATWDEVQHPPAGQSVPVRAAAPDDDDD